MAKIYCMPGMAANSSIFKGLELPREYEIKMLDWIAPLSNEELSDYALRVSEKIEDKKPILLGVSFGGIIVQEMAKIIDYDKIVLVSSVKTNEEFPNLFKVAKNTNAHKLLPISFLSNKKLWDSLSFLDGVRRRQKLYKKYMYLSSDNYLSWAINSIVNWRQEKSLPRTIHIHGTRDEIFPFKNVRNVIPVAGGTHIMIVNRYKWFNEHLPKILKKQ